MFERISFDKEIMGGRACIRGMRIPVSVIVGQIAHSDGAPGHLVLVGGADAAAGGADLGRTGGRLARLIEVAVQR